MGRRPEGWKICPTPSGNFRVRFTHDGKRHEVSLGTTDRAEAAKLAAHVFADVVSGRRATNRSHVAVTPISLSVNRVKIGRARDVRARLRALQIGASHPLELLLVVEAADLVALEEELHARFRRDRLHGEWFTYSAPMFDFIRKHRITDARVSK